MINRKSMMSRRQRIFVFGLLAWLGLAAWTGTAFWQHIDTLQLEGSYKWFARGGALTGEVIALCCLWMHCFDTSIMVRKWALVFSFLLASVLGFHSAALWGLKESEVSQRQTEDRLAYKLTEMSKDQAAGIASTTSRQAFGKRQKERLAMERQARQAQADIAKNAQEQVAKEIISSSEKVKATAIVPRWYLDGWMYWVIFIASFAMLCIIGWVSLTADDIDENYDGIPDREQPHLYDDRQYIPRSSMRKDTESGQLINGLDRGHRSPKD